MRNRIGISNVNVYYEDNIALTEELAKNIIRLVKEYIVKTYDQYLKLQDVYISRPFANSPLSVYFTCIKEDIILYNDNK